MALQPTLLDPVFRAELAELSGGLEADSRERDAVHAQTLSRVAVLRDKYAAAGWSVGVTAELALLLRVSEFRAAALIEQAELLGSLPGGFGELAAGRLTVDTLVVLVDLLKPLEPEVRERVWAELVVRLGKDERAGDARVGARFKEWLRDRIVKADPDGAVQRRKQAEENRKVEYRRRQDGLVDLFALGLTGPNGLACLRAIQQRAEKAGSWDTRSADQRRVDAFVDLVTGRARLGESCTGSGSACGCRRDQPVPCGAQVQVLLPIGAAMGTTDEVAELVGHGPLERDLLEGILLAAPALHPVFVDEHGVPVCEGGPPSTSPRGDRQAVHDALAAMATRPPPPRAEWLPRHQHDHPDRAHEPPDEAHSAGNVARHGEEAHAGATGACSAMPGHEGQHPAGMPGPYRPPRWLRRLLQFRSPRCEWPGCGARAVRCDLDHDTAWDPDDPDGGPTCGCNLGPLCRRHHRVKQLGWTKQRISAGDGGMVVRWTSRLGRVHTTESQHPAPAPPVQPVGPPQRPRYEDTLSDLELEALLWELDPGDPVFDGFDGEDFQPEPGACEDHDWFQAFLEAGGGRWSYDLDDEVSWLDPSYRDLLPSRPDARARK